MLDMSAGINQLVVTYLSFFFFLLKIGLGGGRAGGPGWEGEDRVKPAWSRERKKIQCKTRSATCRYLFSIDKIKGCKSIYVFILKNMSSKFIASICTNWLICMHKAISSIHSNQTFTRMYPHLNIVCNLKICLLYHFRWHSCLITHLNRCCMLDFYVSHNFLSSLPAITVVHM